MAIFILLDIISFLGTPGALGSFIFVPLIFGVGIYQIQKNKSLRGWFIINNLSLAILFSAPAYVNDTIFAYKLYLIITLLIILFINTSSFLSYYSLQEIERYRAEYKCERKEVQGKYFEKISLILIMIVSLLCIVACIISYRYQHQVMTDFLPTIEELCTQCLCAITLILGIELIIRRIPNYGWLLVNVSSLSLLILIPCDLSWLCLIISITSLIITNRKSFKEYYSILK